jgi:hypothetical protein
VALNVRQINATPERIFEVLADGWLYAGWVVGASRMRGVDPTWPNPGSKLHHSFGIWPALINDTTSVLEWSPPERMSLKARGWPVGTARVDLVVTPTAGGSEVRIIEEADEGPARLIPKPIREALLKVRNVETLRRLAFFAEGGAGSPKA